MAVVVVNDVVDYVVVAVVVLVVDDGVVVAVVVVGGDVVEGLAMIDVVRDKWDDKKWKNVFASSSKRSQRYR